MSAHLERSLKAFFPKHVVGLEKKSHATIMVLLQRDSSMPLWKNHFLDQFSLPFLWYPEKPFYLNFNFQLRYRVINFAVLKTIAVRRTVVSCNKLDVVQFTPLKKRWRTPWYMQGVQEVAVYFHPPCQGQFTNLAIVACLGSFY